MRRRRRVQDLRGDGGKAGRKDRGAGAPGRRALALMLLASCLVAILQFAIHTLRLAAAARGEHSQPYSLPVARKTDRVVLFVADSLPIRIAEDESYMPLLHRTMQEGASGLLWATKQTGTLQGIVALGSGGPTSALEFLGPFGGRKLDGYTIFTELEGRGEGVSFNGEPKWFTFFGSPKSHNHSSNGEAASFSDEDLRAIASAEQRLGSAAPPALTVIHITETDVVAHQFGTADPRYRAVIRRWDEVLHGFLTRVLDGHTTVILTSDHGNDAWGSHGGDGDIYRRVPVVMIGKGIRPAHGFTMNSVDMPATLGLLLGARLPGGALAKPATAPLALTAEEEIGALLGAYDHLITLGEEKGVPDAAAHRAKYQELVRLDETGQLAGVTEGVHQAIPGLIESITPIRSLSFAELACVAMVFLAAAALALVAFARGRAAGEARSSMRRFAAPFGIMLGALVAVGAVLAIRLSFVPALKALASTLLTRSARPFLAIGLVATAAVTARALRSRVIPVMERYPRQLILVGFAACSALLPLSQVAFLFLCLLMLSLSQARTPARPAALTMLGFAGYFAVSSAVAWRVLGETPTRRYAYGLSAALVGLVWLWRGPLRGASRARLASLGVLLALFPFNVQYLELGEHAKSFVAIASLGLLGAIVVLRGGSRLCLLAVAVAAVPLLAPSSTVLLSAVGLLGALLIHQLLTGRGQATSLSPACILVAVLAAMSGPSDVPPVVAFFLVLTELAASAKEGDAVPDDLLAALLAAALVGCRYALFEVFGHVDSPALTYGLRNLDVAVGLQSGDNLNLALATTMISLKAVVASSVVLAAVLGSARARRLEPQLIALVGAFMLIDIGYTALRTSLSLGPISDRYDEYLVSLGIRTTMYLSLVLGYATLPRARAEERPPSEIAALGDPGIPES